MVYKGRKPTTKIPPYNVPVGKLEAVARTITGWAIGTIDNYSDSKDCAVTKFTFWHRGGIIFPARKLNIEGVRSVHHFVYKSMATVWVTWQPKGGSKKQ